MAFVSRCASNSAPTYFLDVNWSRYHSSIEITEMLLALNNTFPNLVDVFEIGRSWRNKSIYCVRLTNEAFVFEKPKLLHVGYHHAREPITAELPSYFVMWAAENYRTNATVKRMLDLAETYVVVALNVDGFELIESNDWQRKNARPVDEDEDGLTDEDPPEDVDGDGYVSALLDVDGRFIRWEGVDNDGDGLLNEDWVGGVDLNRNYGYAWNASTMSGSTNHTDQDYKGSFQFSEPETQALRNLALNHNFTYALSFHSGAEVIAYPWFHTNISTKHDRIFRQVAGNLSKLIGVPHTQGGRGLYTSSGIWDDWMYGNRSTIALTCEIYRNVDAWVTKPGPQHGTYWLTGILEAFNPPAYKIPALLSKWLPAFFYLTNRAIDETSPTRDVEVAQAIIETAIAYKGWTININVTVRNNGKEPEDFNVSIYYNEKMIKTQKVERLAHNTEQVLTFVWNTTDVTPCRNYTIWAEANPLLGENLTENNILVAGFVKIGIMGDVNGDASVNIVDLALIATLFGRGYTETESASCDLNRDRQINIIDITIAAVNFGKNCYDQNGL